MKRKQGASFKLRRATFKGTGLQPLVAGASRDQLREMIYQVQGP